MTVTTHSARNTVETTQLWDLALDDIEPSALNPRKHFEPTALEELAASIQEHGLLQPIVVRYHTERLGSPHYTVIAGERRWRAAKLAGLATIQARVLTQIDDAEHLRLALLENLQRRDLDPIEEAEGYAQLNRVLGLRQKEIAAAVNRSQPAVANSMRLLDLPEDVQEHIRTGELSVAHGIALARFKGFPGIMSAYAELAIKGHWTAKDLEKGLPSVYELERKGLVQALHYGHFDRSVCESCPFGAMRAGDWGGVHYCLNPAHFAELEGAWQATQQATFRAKLEAAGEDTQKLPSLRDLNHNYESIGNHCPTGCTEACPCRATALGYDDQSVRVICINPTRYRKLEAADTRAKTKERKAAEKAALARVRSAADRITDCGPAELAILAVAALVQIHKPAAATEAAKRHTPSLDGDKFASWSLRSSVFPKLCELAQTDPVAVARLAVEAVLGSELRDRYAGEGYRDESPWTDWYLEQQSTLAAVLGSEAAE